MTLLLLLQTALILVVTLACGRLACRVGQPRVIGEVIAGIMLGPSSFGHYFPHAFMRLFAKDSLVPLETLSTVGIVFFLFIIGTEVDFQQLYRQRTRAVLTSSMSIIFPFGIAALLAHPLRTRFAPHGIGSGTFLVFLGISMSITAFPVLARILEERNLLNTTVGNIAIFCAAINDVVAWLLLAVALALVANGGFGSLLLRLAVLVLYIAAMLGVLRPLASWHSHKRRSRAMPWEILGLTLVGLFASAAASQAIGIHPLFGGFLAGVCLPRDKRWQTFLRARFDSTVSVVLLPLFFALSGMRTRVDLLNTGTVWIWTGIVLFAAFAGKLGGAILAARLTHQSWRDAFTLGALLNTRGLVELVALNIAYDVGVFTPTLFTMLVMMAVISTISTVPFLNLISFESRRPKPVAVLAR